MSSTKAYGGYNVTFDGDDETRASLDALAQTSPALVGQAFHDELTAELELLDALTPIGGKKDPHVGRLRGSERVLDSVVLPSRIGDGADMIVMATLLIGGPSVGVPYAIDQDVHDSYEHPQGGGAHFLEKTVDQLQSGAVLERVADRVREAFGG